jgi:hypothetical protein
MEPYVFSVNGNWWKQQRSKPAYKRSYWRLHKLAQGNDVDGPTRRDGIEYCADTRYPATTQYLPYSWFIICAG